MYKNGVTLRDYQQDVKSRLFEAWQHERSVMVQMPTGTGKTHVLAAVIKDFLQDNAQNPQAEVWIIAHRRELVVQIEETVAKYGICKDDGWIRVMSIQWLVRHWDDAGGTPLLIVIDEAHHALADSYKELWKRYPDARKLGMTATPCRMSHKGFTYLFDVLVTSWSIAEFIEKGYLSAFDYVSIKQGSDEQRLIGLLEKRGADGDYQIKEMDSLLNRDTSICRLYGSMARFAAGKKGIVYAISIEHARRIAEYYSSQGVVAVSIDSKTPIAERKQMVEDFKAGKIKVLVNVDVFSEGFDCPDVEFVQMARPTLSLSKYLQQVGRGLRRVEGKNSCMMIDNVGLYRIFGLPTSTWDWDAMFRGDIAGKGVHFSRIKQISSLSRLQPYAVEPDLGVGMVISHERLQAELKEQEHTSASQSRATVAFKAWQDKDSGLWGLKHGDGKITDAIFMSVLDIGYDMAAVSMLNGRCGLVDLSGKVIWEKKNCRSMKFIKDCFLVADLQRGSRVYIDLHSFKAYNIKPEIKRYGNVELLKVGHLYYSRTKKVYVTGLNIDSFRVPRRDFYLTLFDINVPRECMRDEILQDECNTGYACLLADDYDSFYWMCRVLEDASIIVRDDNGRYYHVEEGKGKRFIGCNSAGECLDEINRLSERAKENVRILQTEKCRKRQKLLNDINGAVPYKSGEKWGLKVGNRVVVPPVYRNIQSPVGRYCAVEKYYSQWGIIALDGTVIIEPKYTKINIDENGTALITFVTGKKKQVKLR